jgi:acyl-CoA thioesterase-1
VAGMLVPPNMGPDYTAEFQKLFPELAKKNSARLIPFLLQGVAGNDKLNNADGIHPNVEGHKIVANNVLKIVEPLL